MLLDFIVKVVKREAVLRLIRQQSRGPVLKRLRRLVPNAMLFVDNPTLHRVSCGCENSAVDLV